MRYLVTGASGFLGGALTKKLLEQGHSVVAIARHENSLLEYKKQFPEVEIIIGDVADEWTVIKGMRGVQGIFHLAASKHIGLAEKDVFQTIKSNITGSQVILQESFNQKPEFVIGISTDKAAQVSGVYGATKLLMERLFSEAEILNPLTDYRIVRYGNVLGSTGSILPKWKAQLEKGEEVTVTDPNATRFFWTVDEAVDLIFECLAKSKDATPYVPKMKAMSVGNILLAIWEKYGKGDLKIKEIGLQKGENMHESMDGKIFSNQVEQFTIKEIKEKI
jgi:UDP-N-acetylglucosamine 4,6-dehydratase/UDP-glucose 4-epimerase